MKATGFWVTKRKIEEVKEGIFNIKIHTRYISAMKNGKDEQRLSAYRSYCNAVISMLEENFHSGTKMMLRAIPMLRRMSHLSTVYLIEVERVKIVAFLEDLSYQLDTGMYIHNMPTCRDMLEPSPFEIASVIAEQDSNDTAKAIKAGVGVIKGAIEGGKIYNVANFYNDVRNSLNAEIIEDARQPCEIEQMLLSKFNEELENCTAAAIKTGILTANDSAKLIQMAIKNK